MRPRVSNFLSHRIVKSLTFRIVGKLEFQCIRNGPQHLLLSRVSPGCLCYLFPDIPPTHLSQKIAKTNISRIKNLEIRKSEHQGSLTSAQIAIGRMDVDLTKSDSGSCGWGGGWGWMGGIKKTMERNKKVPIFTQNEGCARL